MKEIFHVHTYRCKHASDESDEKLIQCAISLGAEKIVFTDHVPFPENLFRNRMEIEEIGEYLETLSALKEKYQNQIEIKSSDYHRHKSMDIFTEKFSKHIGSRFLVYTKEYRKDADIFCIPMYLFYLITYL